MAKESEDKHGASDSGGAEPSDSVPAHSESPVTPPMNGDEQSELPLDHDPPRDDQAQDQTQGEDSHIAGEVDLGHDDPYHDEYDESYHDEYHQEHYDEYGHEGVGTGGGDSGGGGYGSGGSDNEGDGEFDDEAESYGGPVKPFLNHLEDLRWTVMKCVIAMAAGMLVALLGAGYIVDFLAGPLEEAQKMEKVLAQGNPEKRTIPVLLGEGVVGSVHEADLEELQKNGMLRGAATNLTEITSLNLEPIQ